MPQWLESLAWPVLIVAACLVFVINGWPAIRGVVGGWFSRVNPSPDESDDTARREALAAAELAYRLADYFADLDDAEGIEAATTCARRAVMAPFVEGLGE